MQDTAPGWYSAIIWCLNGLIFLTIITFMCKFSQNRGKEIGLYMTLIPNFSYLVYSCFDILSEAPSFRDRELEIQAIKTSIAHFCLYWSASFGLFTRLNAIAPRSPHFMPQYMVTSLILCLVIAVSTSAIYLRRPHIDHVFVLSAYSNVLLPFFFSLIVLILAYFQRNRGNCHVALASLRSTNYLRIFWYSLVPIVCLGVDLLVDIYRQTHKISNSEFVAIITSIIYRTWAIASLVKYWLVTKAHRERVASVGNLDLSLIHETMNKRTGSILHTSTV